MRPLKESHRRKQGQLSHPGEADEGRYFRANGHEYGRWPEEGHVTGTSRGADAGCFCGLNTQHDPWQASAFAWRAGGDDNGLSARCSPSCSVRAGASVRLEVKILLQQYLPEPHSCTQHGRGLHRASLNQVIGA